MAGCPVFWPWDLPSRHWPAPKIWPGLSQTLVLAGVVSNSTWYIRIQVVLIFWEVPLTNMRTSRQWVLSDSSGLCQEHIFRFATMSLSARKNINLIQFFLCLFAKCALPGLCGSHSNVTWATKMCDANASMTSVLPGRQNSYGIWIQSVQGVAQVSPGRRSLALGQTQKGLFLCLLQLTSDTRRQAQKKRIPHNLSSLLLQQNNNDFNFNIHTWIYIM